MYKFMQANNVMNHKKFKKIKWLFGKDIEIPEEWKVNRLEELGDIITGNTPDTNNKEYYANDYYWASPTDLDKNKYVIKTHLMLSKKGFNISRKIPKNSILVACIGSIGKIGLSYQEMATNQQINSIICNQASPHFIYYQLQQNNSLIKNMANQSVVPILNKTEFGKLKIIIPKKTNEQQKIASTLSSVDALIESTQGCIEKIQKLKKGLMQILLTKGINHKKFKKIKTQFNSYEVIPHEWQIKKIGDIFKFLITGTNPRVDLDNESNIKYIHYGDIHVKWNTVLDCDISNMPRINQNKIKKIDFLKEGDLIMADVSEDYEGMGASISLKNVKGRKIVSGLHTFALRNIDDQVSNDFIAYLTSFSFIKKQIIKYTTGTSVYGISKNNFKKIEILCMSLTEQQKIASILSEVDAYVQSNQQYKEKLIKLKKGLMQKLLTGQIRVKI